MFDTTGGSWKVLLSLILFPTMFQEPFLSFAWGADDFGLTAFLKRIFLIMPAFSVIFASWITILCILTIVIRQNRRQFVSALFLTWWDLCRAIFHFWGGIFKFLAFFASWVFGFVRLVVLSLVLIMKDILMIPVRLMGDFSHVYFSPGIPWAAVVMMLFWTLLESLIFTYVMTPLITDVLSAIAGNEISGPMLQIPMYLTFVVIVLGSYAVLHSFGVAMKERDIPKIISYSIVEFVVAMTEVVFLYREFVDALVPWFAQHAGAGFELGIFGTLAIATFAWLGIRAMTWFLFGASAIPTMMAMIQRTELKGGGSFFSTKKSDTEKTKMRGVFVYIHEAVDDIKKDWNWVEEKSEKLVSSFLVPPLQLVAAMLNFCTLLISRTHLFELPFASYKDIMDSKALLNNLKKSLTDQF